MKIQIPKLLFSFSESIFEFIKIITLVERRKYIEEKKNVKRILNSAQGFKGFPTASRFWRVRFKNSKAKDFWREDFFRGEVVQN
jgi:hypothetical protein